MHPGRPPWPPAVINQKTTTIMLIVAAVYLCVFFFFSIWWYLIVRFYPGCVYGATTYVESFTFAIVTQMTIGARGARVGGVGMGEGWGGVGGCRGGHGRYSANRVWWCACVGGSAFCWPLWARHAAACPAWYAAWVPLRLG